MRPKSDISCSRLGGLCQANRYICQGRYLKDKCSGDKTSRDNGLHKAVDLVCDDYGIVNAPFSGSLMGPVSRKEPAGIQYDGIKFLNDEHCVKIFNIRPYRYMGPVAQGVPLGYLLPLQDRFSGITSHLELQMCDGSDPSPFI
ncbi:myeloid protein 1-like [Anoplopoma fimbria]|uniref:myeloid protein 1-like n=1 Tax=Anoplopoma fimbria TaxID=229290 RepID=UPI0023ED0195|nr:myeloid protein 1-like [Anoplopoma fimbria]